MADQADKPPVRDNPSKAEFQQDYLIPQQPVILQHAAQAMPALKLWTPAWFKAQHGHTLVKVNGATLPMSDLIDAVTASTAQKPGPYLHNCYLQMTLPALLPHIQPPLIHAAPNWLNGRGFPRQPAIPSGLTGLFIGGAGTGFPVLHQDTHHTHAFITQIYGSKEIYLIPPGLETSLYLDPEVPTWSQVNPRQPDLQRFPAFAEVPMLRYRLTAGQTLFIPPRWWHTTHMDEPSISISLNQVEAANWAPFSRSLANTQTGFKRLQLKIHLWLLGRLRARQGLGC